MVARLISPQVYDIELDCLVCFLVICDSEVIPHDMACRIRVNSEDEIVFVLIYFDSRVKIATLKATVKNNFVRLVHRIHS